MKKSSITKIILFLSVLYIPVMIFVCYYFLFNDHQSSVETFNSKEVIPSKKIVDSKTVEEKAPFRNKLKKNNTILVDIDIKDKSAESEKLKPLKIKHVKKKNVTKKNTKRKRLKRKKLSAREHGRLFTNHRHGHSAKVAANQQLNLKSWRDKNLANRLNQLLDPADSSDNQKKDLENNIERVAFKVTFQNIDGKPLAGGMISTNSPVDLKEKTQGVFTEFPTNFKILATTNIFGSTNFNLKESGYPINLYFLYNYQVFKVFTDKVNKESAWKTNTIKLDAKLLQRGEVFGVVKNLSGQGLQDALISNIPVESIEEHHANLKNKNYRFIASNKKGEFFLGGLELDKKFSLYCFLPDYPVVQTKELLLSKQKRIIKYDFKIRQARLEPAVWLGKMVDQHGKALKDIKFGTALFEDYSQAIGKGEFYTSDEKGNFSFLVKQYEKPIKLYHYDESAGVKLLKEHLFVISEKYYSTNVVEVVADFKGSIGIRLQDKNGKVASLLPREKPLFEIFLLLKKQNFSIVIHWELKYP